MFFQAFTVANLGANEQGEIEARQEGREVACLTPSPPTKAVTLCVIGEETRHQQFNTITVRPALSKDTATLTPTFNRSCQKFFQNV